MDKGVKCEFISVCTDYPKLCDHCKKNKGRRSHFEPDKKEPLGYPLRRKEPFLKKKWKMALPQEKSSHFEQKLPPVTQRAIHKTLVG